MQYKKSASDNKNPKSFFHRYLKNIDESEDSNFVDVPPKLETELLDGGDAMKRRFRSIAKSLKNYF